ncbi:hypothetical protein ScPMuIL_010629 [Solemya velum]
MGGSPSQVRRLHDAIQLGQFNEVVHLSLRLGYNAQFCATSPLYKAIDYKQEKIALFLLGCGAKVEIGKKKDTPLLCASRKGLHRVVEKLLKLGANVNNVDHNGCSPLWAAVSEGRRDIVELLLLQPNIDANKACRQYKSTPDHAIKTQYGIILNVPCYGKSFKAENSYHIGMCSPLEEAVKNQNIQMIDLLCFYGVNLDNSNSHGWTPLHYACFIGDITTVALLIFHKCNINAITSKNETPLYIASAVGHKEIVKMLIKAGCDLNTVRGMKNQRTPRLAALHAAICCKHTQVVEVLCNAGADINLIIHSEPIDADITPFMLACYLGHLDEVNILFRHGVKTSGSTQAEHQSISPLLLAFYGQNNAVVERLLEEHVPVNVADDSASALYYATICGSLKILTLIIEEEADLQALDQEGYNPLFFSMKKNRLHEACLLLQHGATLPPVLTVDWFQTLDTNELEKVCAILAIFARKSPRFRHLYQTIILSGRLRPGHNEMASDDDVRKEWKMFPFSLKDVCRECIRNRLISKVKTSILPLIDLLPFPRELREFLAFSELQELFVVH